MRDRSEGLLNTAEAARFLRVSQASIRRWSDAGLLRASRVGRRRERRFRESDLIAFMQEQVAGRPSGGAAVNIAGVSVPLPAHVATFFSTDSGGLRLTIPFLAEGLRLGQPTFLVADGQLRDRYLDALKKQDGVDLAAAGRSGLFTTLRFNGNTGREVVAMWEGYFADALAREATVIRLVGEMVFARSMFVSESEMLDYEELFEVMYSRYPLVAICQYDVRAFDGMALLRALKAHPDLFEFRLGTFLN